MNHPINEGYTVEDMIKVIDIMCDKWLPEAKMHQYLRPETLFGNKFAGYLNSAAVDKKQRKTRAFQRTTFSTRRLRGLTEVRYEVCCCGGGVLAERKQTHGGVRPVDARVDGHGYRRDAA